MEKAVYLKNASTPMFEITESAAIEACGDLCVAKAHTIVTSYLTGLDWSSSNPADIFGATVNAWNPEMNVSTALRRLAEMSGADWVTFVSPQGLVRFYQQSRTLTGVAGASGSARHLLHVGRLMDLAGDAQSDVAAVHLGEHVEQRLGVVEALGAGLVEQPVDAAAARVSQAASAHGGGGIGGHCRRRAGRSGRGVRARPKWGTTSPGAA